MFNHIMEFYETENYNVYPNLLTSSYVYYMIKAGDLTGCLMTHLYIYLYIFIDILWNSHSKIWEESIKC